MRQRRALSFLSVGDQIRIEHACDFSLAEAFPVTDGGVADPDAVRDLCEAATECARMLESDSRAVHETENDAKAMIEEWRATDDALQQMISKIGDLEFEHETCSRVVCSAQRASSGLSALRRSLADDASARIARRCWECDEAASRAQFIRKHTGHLLGDSPGAGSCSICYRGAVSAAFLPCGHCFCRECADRAGGCCYMCRGDISRVMPLYF